MGSGAVIPLKVFEGQDFYVPSFRILVESKELRVETGDILSVTYSDSLSSVDSFDMTVTNWDAEKLGFKYSDSDTFNPWKDVEVWMGYYKNGQDERRRMLIGEITTLSPNFPASGGPTLTVRGLNLFHRFRTKQETKTFLQKKDTQVAQDLVDSIAQEIKKTVKGLTLKLDADDASRNLRTEQPIPYLVMNNQYPILFLMERARRIGYELTMEEEATGGQRTVTFHFRPTSYISNPTYELSWGTSLVSFQPTLQTANQVAEVTVRGWDVRGKNKFEETVKRSELATERVIDPSTDLAVTEPALAQKLEIVADRPIQTKAEAKELARKTLLQIAQDMVVAKGKTVGLPDLRAGVKVQIKGLGTRFSGPENKPFQYLVTETTHNIGDGGYTTDFTARMEK
jgi:phage protein D